MRNKVDHAPPIFLLIILSYLRSLANALGFICTSPGSGAHHAAGQPSSHLIHIMPVAGVLTMHPVYSVLLPGLGPVIVKLGCSRDVEHDEGSP